jgi:hypothetical protein
MPDGYIQHRLYGGEPGCEFEQTLRGEYCGEKSEVRLDGLRLCERHSDQLHFEERVGYWRAILGHTYGFGLGRHAAGAGETWCASLSPSGRGRRRLWSVLPKTYREAGTARTVKSAGTAQTVRMTVGLRPRGGLRCSS